MSGGPSVLLGLIEGLPPRDMPFARFEDEGRGRAREHGDGDVASRGLREVSDDELSVILSAARVAPSADNAQIWRFVTVRDPGTRSALSAAAPDVLERTFLRAPVIVVACGVRFIVTRTRKEQPFAMVDVPIALLHLLLQAGEMGLDRAWTLDCDEAGVREALGVPGDTRVVAMVALGGNEERRGRAE